MDLNRFGYIKYEKKTFACAKEHEMANEKKGLGFAEFSYKKRKIPDQTGK